MNSRFRPGTWLPLFACLLWGVLPGASLAALDVPRAAPRLALSGPWAEAEPGAEEAPPEVSTRAQAAPTGLRLTAQVGAGLLTSASLAVLGGAMGYGLCSIRVWQVPSGDLECGGPLILLGLVGLVEGYGLGVGWSGALLGGGGHLFPTLLGTNLGLMVGLIAAVAMRPSFEVGLGLTAGAILLGSHLGYESSRRPASAPALQPLLSFSRDGGVVGGLGGRF